jgi:TrmH family RNA methyltransferase
MERISALKSPPGSLLIYRTDFEVPARESRIILGLNRVSDPGNLGSIIRTADWFGVSRVILSRQSAELHHPLTVRGSMGAVFRIPVSEEAELAEEAYRLKREGCKIAIAATRGGVRPGKLEGKIALFFSDEQGNLPEEIVRNAEVIFTIPRLGGGESLNLGVACGVILNEITKSRIEKRSKNDKKSHFKKL